MPNAEGLFNKIGISIDQVGTSKYADMGNVSRPMMEYEKQALQNYTENYYNIFVGRCAKGRNMTPAQLDSIGQGRVWTGKQALTLGLVDKIGGLNDAVKIAAQLAKIDEYSIMETPTVPTFMEELFGLSAPDEAMVDRALQEWFGSDYALVKQMRNLKQRDCIQALMPWQIQTR
jgi:protease-4